MKKTQQKVVRLRPKYIKNASGKIVEVYLNIKEYEAMLKTLEALEDIKKQLKSA